MLNEIDNILQEIDKFKGSVQSSEEFAKQLHKDLAVIEAYTDTVKSYEQQLLSAIEKTAKEIQEKNETLTTRIESLIKRKLQWLLLISALNSVGILLLLFLR